MRRHRQRRDLRARGGDWEGLRRADARISDRVAQRRSIEVPCSSCAMTIEATWSAPPSPDCAWYLFPASKLDHACIVTPSVGTPSTM